MVTAILSLQLSGRGNCKGVDVHFPFPVTQLSKVFLNLCCHAQHTSHCEGEKTIREVTTIVKKQLKKYTCISLRNWIEKIYIINLLVGPQTSSTIFISIFAIVHSG